MTKTDGRNDFMRFQEAVKGFSDPRNLYGGVMTVYGGFFAIGRNVRSREDQVSQVNREAEQAFERNAADNQRILATERTTDGGMLNVVFTKHGDPNGEKRVFGIREVAVRAGLELLGIENLSPSFFREDMLWKPLPPAENAKLRKMKSFGFTNAVLGILGTDDPAWNAVIVGWPPAELKEIPPAERNWDLNSLQKMYGEDWSKQARSVLYISKATLDEIIATQESDFFHQNLLPEGGLGSERAKIFAPLVNSFSQFPKIQMKEQDDLIFGEFFREKNPSLPLAAPETSEAPAP